MKFFLLVLFCLPLSISATDYYVAVDGNDANSGLSVATPWKTISFAATQVLAGDTVFIKAGDYGNENIVMTVDGSAGNPISFIGYQNTPGDNPQNNYVIGSALDASIMPTLNGGDRNTGIAINLTSRSYINLQNIQIHDYANGIYAYATTNSIVDNITAITLGDVNASYSGQGIVFGSFADNNTIKNCLVYNAAAENISVAGNNNTIDNCKSFSDDNQTSASSTDYYIVAAGNNNLIKNCYAERIGNLEHGGHGIGFKEYAQDSLIEDSTSVNMSGSFYFRHSPVFNNTIRNCHVLNSDEGLLMRDGAHDNVFENCIIDNAYYAIAFIDAFNEDDGAPNTAEANVIKNSLITNTRYAVIAFEQFERPSDVVNNRIENCTIDNAQYLIYSERENINNSMTNTIITNVANYSIGSVAVNFNFDYSNFWNNGFATPIGSNNLSVNPSFTQVGSHSITVDSPMKDAGDPSYSADADDVDLNGDMRIINSIIDMGVDEYNEFIMSDSFE